MNQNTCSIIALPSQKNEVALMKLRKGFTRIPNSILMEIVHGNLPKAEVKILLLIARFTISFDERRTAPLSKADIERYTLLQGKNILEALASLEKKNLIIKIKGDQYTSNQLGLSYPTEPNEKEPLGEDTKSTYPQGIKGTYPPDLKSTYPEGTKSTYFKESFSKDSFKESLSNEIVFPDDMSARWQSFEKSGNVANAKKEREIFNFLFEEHKEEFFDHCGKVVTFLEQHGNGKPGEAGKVRCPMVWLNGHWKANFARYQAWKAQETAKEAPPAKDAQTEEQAKADEQAKQKADVDSAKVQAKMEADTQRFLTRYPSEAERSVLVENAIQLAGCAFTLSSWKRQGWASPIVRSCVISHFLKTETTTQL